MASGTDTRRRARKIVARLGRDVTLLSSQDREDRRCEARALAEYQQLMRGRCDKFRPVFEAFLKVCRLAGLLDDIWRRRVFTGAEKYDPKDESSVRDLYAVWLGYCQQFEERAEYLSRHGGDFTAELRRLDEGRRAAQHALKEWAPPVLSTAPFLRPRTLSPEATARLREILEGPVGG